jgi:hypothetical protein
MHMLKDRQIHRMLPAKIDAPV